MKLLLLALMAFGYSTWAGPACPEFKGNLNNFGPRRYQDGHGSCWAFTTAALMEEDTCLHDKTQCGLSLSPMDAQRCDFRFNRIGEDGKLDEGSFPKYALLCVLQGGVCPDKYAPFNRQGMIESCENGADPARVAREGGGNCMDNALIDTFRAYRSRSCNGGYKTGVQALAETAARLLAIAPESQDNGVDVVGALTSSTTEQEFLMRMLITPKCKQNRTPVPDHEMASEYGFLESESVNDRLQHVIHVLQKGRSMALNICLKEGADSLVPHAKCGTSRHSVVLNGMRVGPDGTCEVNLRNSWGEGSVYDGWVSASKILRSAYSITYVDKSP